MRITQIVLGLVLVFSLLLSPISIFAQNDASPSAEKVDVYGLFWPIVPGTTLADSTFFLKQIKESLLGMMKFGNVAQAENKMAISEKRLVEAAKLVEDKDFGNAVKSIELSSQARVKALELKKKAVEEKADTVELVNKLVKSFENQQKALIYLESQMNGDEKAKMDEILKQMPLQISEAK